MSNFLFNFLGLSVTAYACSTDDVAGPTCCWFGADGATSMSGWRFIRAVGGFLGLMCCNQTILQYIISYDPKLPSLAAAASH